MDNKIDEGEKDEMTSTEQGESGGKRRGSLYAPCLLYTSPSPRDGLLSRMPSSA